MDFMSENTAEVVERITTERETLRYQLAEAKARLKSQTETTKKQQDFIDELREEIKALEAENQKLKAAQ